MNKKTAIILLATILSTVLAGLFMGGQLALAGEDSKKGEESTETIPLKEAKLNIEHNAKDKDTGFQGFLIARDGSG